MILAEETLDGYEINFTDIKINTPGKYLLVAAFVNILDFSSFVYSKELSIEEIISKIKIFLQ